MRVLVVRAGALGDVLLLRRATAALRHGGHEPVLLAPRSVATALVGPGPSEVHSVLEMDGPWLAAVLSGNEEALHVLDGFDAALAVTRSVALLERLAQRIPLLLVRDPQPKGEHASLWAAAPLAALDCLVSPDPPPSVVPTREEEDASRQVVRHLDGSFLAIHPGSGSPKKNWPPQAYAELVRRISNGRPWLLVRGPAEAGAECPLEDLPGAVPVTDWPLRPLGALLSHARLFVGGDSGVSHLAAAWGAPVLALFGPTDPSLWAPVGRNVEVLESATSRMEDLSVDTVVASALDRDRSIPFE